MSKDQSPDRSPLARFVLAVLLHLSRGGIIPFLLTVSLLAVYLVARVLIVLSVCVYRILSGKEEAA
jgi:hypothetical protein